MEKYIIRTKYYKNGGSDYIKIITSLDKALYTYYKKGIEQKSSFNKYSFIEYLKSIKVPKKYINEI